MARNNATRGDHRRDHAQATDRSGPCRHANWQVRSIVQYNRMDPSPNTGCYTFFTIHSSQTTVQMKLCPTICLNTRQSTVRPASATATDGWQQAVGSLRIMHVLRRSSTFFSIARQTRHQLSSLAPKPSGAPATRPGSTHRSQTGYAYMEYTGIGAAQPLSALG